MSGGFAFSQSTISHLSPTFFLANGFKSTFLELSATTHGLHEDSGLLDGTKETDDFRARGEMMIRP